MNILLPALYAGTAALHIFSIHAEKRRLRFASKICLMPVLLSFYIYKTDAPAAAIIAALVFSWAGDMLLARPKKYGLYAGIGSFFAAHAAYGFAFISLAPSPRGLVYVFLCALAVPPGFLFIVKPRAAAPLRVAGALYASAVCLLVVFAARVFAYYKNLPALALTGGALLFFVSDALLAWFNTVRPMTKKALIAVMSTYITAQAAIVSAYAALA